MERPRAVAFDVVETMFSLASLRARLEAVGLPGTALPTFFAQMLRDAFALEASGVYKPFAEVASASLEVLMRTHGLEAGEDAVKSVLSGFAQLNAHPDVEPALERLAAAGIRLATLTNGSAANTAKLLERSRFARYFERTISIDEVGRWKPNAAVYRHAARSLAVQPSSLMLIAGHAWDVHGAKRAGLEAAWVKRQDAVFSKAMEAADISGAHLGEVVDAILS